MTSAEHLSDEEIASIEHDRDLAWELYSFQEDHPQIPVLAQSVLAREPSFTGMILLHARYLVACNEIDEARRMLEELAGRLDRQFINTLRDLHELEMTAKNYPAALKYAADVVREDPEANWNDHMNLAHAMIFIGQAEAGWNAIDNAVARCARDTPDSYANALGQRATIFLTTGAPLQRFVPAAEEAIAADPTELLLSLTLGIAYVYTYRFDEAEGLFRRILREDPTEEVTLGMMIVLKPVKQLLDSGEAAVEQLRELGYGEMVARVLKETVFDTGLQEALAAFDALMSVEFAATFRAPLPEEAVLETGGSRDVMRWHDGQHPGTGFDTPHGRMRLMTNADIAAMDEEMEAKEPQWAWLEEREEPLLSQLFTDDEGGYIIEGFAGRLVMCKPSVPDEIIAPSLADWFWDRVAELGGNDPRVGVPTLA